MTEKQKRPLSPTDIITPECRLNYPSLFSVKPKFKPSADNPNPPLTYQAVLILPPSCDLAPFFAALKAAMIAKWGQVIQLPAAKNPIHDAAEKAGSPGYDAGCHYINCHSKDRVPLVDRRGVPLGDKDKDKIYAGVWVRAYLNAYAWQHQQGGKGVSFGMNAIQLLRDGEPLTSRRSVDDVFEPLPPVEGGASDVGFGDDPAASLFG